MPTAGRIRYLEARPPAGVRDAGTLVLLHAFPLNARMWEQQLALAGRGWRIIAPHARGADGGQVDRPVQSMDDYAGDTVDLLDTLHIEDAVVAGLSMGGYLAFALLRLAPNYIRGLILADTKAEADTPEARENRRRTLTVLTERGVDAVIEELLPKLLAPPTRENSPSTVERVRELARSNSVEAVTGMIHALIERQDAVPQLASIRVPTLIVVGEDDAITPLSQAEAMQTKISGSELVTIRAAGHLSNLEQPDDFNGALARFLDHRV